MIGQTPVRLASTSLHSSYQIDYYNFTAGVPPASLWTLPSQCSHPTGMARVCMCVYFVVCVCY